MELQHVEQDQFKVNLQRSPVSSTFDFYFDNLLDFCLFVNSQSFSVFIILF